jgi:hypothetical protein
MIRNKNNDIESFEFLTSNFGGVLLNESFSIIVPDGQDGCEPFKDIINDSYDINENIDRHAENSMSMNGYYKVSLFSLLMPHWLVCIIHGEN